MVWRCVGHVKGEVAQKAQGHLRQLMFVVTRHMVTPAFEHEEAVTSLNLVRELRGGRNQPSHYTDNKKHNMILIQPLGDQQARIVKHIDGLYFSSLRKEGGAREAICSTMARTRSRRRVTGSQRSSNTTAAPPTRTRVVFACVLSEHHGSLHCE